jgi:hypothetical protein
MIGLGARGVATIAIVIVVVSTAGGVSTPVIVDEMDTLPDSPFYGLERLGEGMKEAVVGGQGFDLDRLEERTSEFAAMAEKGKSQKYLELIDEAEDRACSAIDRAADRSGVEVASEAVLKHIEVLEGLLEKVPDQAKVAISTAICRSSKGIEVLADLRAGEIPFGRARPTLEDIKSWAERLRTTAEENLGKGMSVEDVIRNLDLEVADDLIDKISAVAAEHLDKYTEVENVARERLDSALEHTDNLEELPVVEGAVLKHLAVLESVYENVPEQAKIAICLAISKCTDQVVVVAEVKAGKLQLGEELKNRLKAADDELGEVDARAKENLRRGIPVNEVVVNVEIEVIAELREKLENLAQDLSDNGLAAMLLNRINAVTRMVDSEEALQRAIDASQNAVSTLENVLTRAPEVAKEYIELAKAAVQKHVEILENALSRYRSGLVTDIREAIGVFEETLKEYRAEFGETLENMARHFISEYTETAGPRVY